MNSVDSIQSILPIPFAISIGVGLLSLLLLRRLKWPKCGIPSATESFVMFGHALAYKNDPAAFLLRQSRLVGSVFRINLAGRRMIVLCGGASDMEMDLVKKATTLPERILSARDAVFDLGFEHTLGKANVYEGADFHKRLIKDHLNRGEETVPLLVSALQEAYKVEIDNNKNNGKEIIVKDFLGLVRRCTIRSVIDVFLGRAFLRPNNNNEEEGSLFLDEFMKLQDAIEDATAAAAVLPKFLSLPLILRPVKRSRLKLQKCIAKRILDAWRAPMHKQGPWLKEF